MRSRQAARVGPGQRVSTRAAGTLRELLHVMTRMKQGVETSEQKQGVISVHYRQKTQAICYQVLDGSVRFPSPQFLLSMLRAERAVRVREGQKRHACGNRKKQN
jgi:hypothetical protein